MSGWPEQNWPCWIFLLEVEGGGGLGKEGAKWGSIGGEGEEGVQAAGGKGWRGQRGQQLSDQDLIFDIQVPPTYIAYVGSGEFSSAWKCFEDTARKYLKNTANTETCSAAALGDTTVLSALRAASIRDVSWGEGLSCNKIFYQKVKIELVSPPGVTGAIVPGVRRALLVVKLHPSNQVQEPEISPFTLPYPTHTGI